MDRFSRAEHLLGRDALLKLKNSKVIVIDGGGKNDSKGLLPGRTNIYQFARL